MGQIKEDRNTRIEVSDYALLTFLILWSGGGFTYGLFPRWMIPMFFVVSGLFVHRHLSLNRRNFIVFFFFLLVVFLQLLQHGGALISVAAPLFTIGTCMMLAVMLCNKFNRAFVNIMLFFAKVSLVLWAICYMPGGKDLLTRMSEYLPQLGWENLRDLEQNSAESVRSVYLYSFSSSAGLIRNFGPFWEPGRFTIFLSIALLLNLFYFKENILSKKNLILILANISTFSTTGYSAMGIIFITYIFWSDLPTNRKVVLSILLLVMFPYICSLDFMSEKITNQYSDSDVEWSRFGAVLYHLEQIKEAPLIGYGPYLNRAFVELVVSPNGLTDLLRYYGIPLSLFLFVMLYKSVRMLLGKSRAGIAAGGFAAIMALCFSQTITYSPFFYLLYFFPIKLQK